MFIYQQSILCKKLITLLDELIFPSKLYTVNGIIFVKSQSAHYQIYFKLQS